MPQYMLLIYTPAEGGPSQASARPRCRAGSSSRTACATPGSGLRRRPARRRRATTVRVRAGETQITDGPFAETKELLGGYYVIDVPDLDTALEHAGAAERAPTARSRSGPLIDFSQTAMAENQAQASA